MLKGIFNIIGGNQANLLDLRNFNILLLSYVGFLRFDELVNLTKGDLQFFDSHMSAFIEKSKTDIYRDGHTVIISKLVSALCPVNMILKYIAQARIFDDKDYLCRATTWWKHQGQHSLRTRNKPICYSTARDSALALIKRTGLDPKNFGLHSARSGGATSAANNGVPDRLFIRHGRWKSDKAKDGYIKDSLSKLLSVSRNLGL